MTLPSYGAYKDSCVAWIGRIPTSWNMTRLGFECETLVPMRDKPERLDGPIPWVRIEDFDGKFIAASKSQQGVSLETVRAMNLKVFPAGTVLCSCSCSMGATAIASHPLVSNQTFIGIVPGSRFLSDYLYYYLNAAAAYLDSIGTGAIQAYLSRDDFRQLRVPQPSWDEQAAIASFLDRETAKIDALITEQEKLIALLAEKRQATISHAVTRGLNPDAPMKDSGVPWLGEVPEHWERVQLGRLCTQVSDGPHFSPKYVDAGVLFISARNIRVDGWALDDAKFVSEADYHEFCKRVVPEVGDVLYTKGGTTGIARVVDLEERFQVWVHVAVLKLNKELALPHYAAYALNSIGCYEQSQLYTRGATNQDLGLTRMVKILLGLPPLEEQAAIVNHLDVEVKKLDTLNLQAQWAVNLLKERRSALITAAVTGQIDVRGLVKEAKLEPEPLAA